MTSIKYESIISINYKMLLLVEFCLNDRILYALTASKNNFCTAQFHRNRIMNTFV